MKIANTTIDYENETITHHWSDGQNTTYDLRTLPDDVRSYALCDRFNAKLRDCFAGASSKGWTVADCRNETAKVWQTLESGEWDRNGGGSVFSIWVRAIARAYGETDLSHIEKVYNAMPRDEQKETRDIDAVKIAKLEIETERARSKSKNGATKKTDIAARFAKS